MTRGGLRLGILGNPAKHSLSPALHRAALADLAIEGSYEAWEVDAEGAKQVLDDLRSGSIDGCNVTMPFKGLAFEYVDRRSDLADRTGSVNTVVAADGELVGHNTDVGGIVGAWQHRDLPVDGRVMVLGAGGAAAAALVALDDRDVVVAARSEAAARAVIRKTRSRGTVVAWGTPIAGAVVNATPIGMNGHVHPPAVVAAATAWFEMVYAHGSTDAELSCLENGKPVSSGTDMLLHQAVLAFRIWTGQQPSFDAMADALPVIQQPQN